MAAFFFILILVILAFCVFGGSLEQSSLNSNPFSILIPKDKNQVRGVAGENAVYYKLLSKYNIPSDQIFRNVYVPDKNGKTSEIDIVAVTNKGLFVFECKNYAGNIYGDAKKEKWIQYVGNKKSFFYSPILQNKKHCKVLSNYLVEFGAIPTISVIATTDRGNWKLNNLEPADCILGYNCSFEEIYGALSDDPETIASKERIKDILYILSNPSQSIKEKHIASVLENRR